VTRPWLVVAGGVHRNGGQDRANLELVRHLAFDRRVPVSVVTHEADRALRGWPGIDLHVVHRPLRSIALGERLLESEGRRVHASLGSTAIALSNGGNYLGANVTWMHSVHAVWPVRDEGAPLLRQALTRLRKGDARRREERIARSSGLLVANSAKTAGDLVRALSVPPERIVIVRFGADPPERPAGAGRSSTIGFIGAHGWDNNKGLDTALQARSRLTGPGERDYKLCVAGPGSTFRWKTFAARLGIENRVTFVGNRSDIPVLLASLDLVISPVRYEAYGLAVQEALVAGVPSLVSSDAGIAEYLLPVLPSLLVREKEDPEAWARAIRNALDNLEDLRVQVRQVGAMLARRSWGEMAADLVSAVESRREPAFERGFR
jgi:glycosyltransferase involved in cell wall biosynthesis